MNTPYAEEKDGGRGQAGEPHTISHTYTHTSRRNYRDWDSNIHTHRQDERREEVEMIKTRTTHQRIR